MIFQYENGAKKGNELAGAEPGQERVGQKVAELGPVWDLATGSYFEGSSKFHKLNGELTDTICEGKYVSSSGETWYGWGGSRDGQQ